MKLSTAIEKMQALVEMYGDLDVNFVGFNGPYETYMCDDFELEQFKGLDSYGRPYPEGMKPTITGKVDW